MVILNFLRNCQNFPQQLYHITPPATPVSSRSTLILSCIASVLEPQDGQTPGPPFSVSPGFIRSPTSLNSPYPPSLFFGHTTWLEGYQFPNQGLNPHLQQWNHGVLTTGPPVNSFFPGGASGKEPANAGDTKDGGLIPGLGQSPGGGVATHSSILAWRIPWTEEPGSLWSIVLQSWTRLKQLCMYALLPGTLSFLLHLLAVNLIIYGSASPPLFPEPRGPRASIHACHRLHLWLIGNLPLSPPPLSLLSRVTQRNPGPHRCQSHPLLKPVPHTPFTLQPQRKKGLHPLRPFLSPELFLVKRLPFTWDSPACLTPGALQEPA